MEIKISYSKNQLERAIKFISVHNNFFIDQDEYIRESILESIEQIAKDPECPHLGTIGFTLIADREFEDLDSDENNVRIEILVDPALMDDIYTMAIYDDEHEEVISYPSQSVWGKESDEVIV